MDMVKLTDWLLTFLYFFFLQFSEIQRFFDIFLHFHDILLTFWDIKGLISLTFHQSYEADAFFFEDASIAKLA